jgi:Ca-activated chloride channel homolog
MPVRTLLAVSLVFFASSLLHSQALKADNSLATAPAMALPAVDALSTPSLPTIVKHVDEVHLLLSVTNRRGRFVHNLNPSDLVISDNGEPPDKITYFQRQTDLPLRVALVIDTSDSVKHRFAFEKKSAQMFLKKVLRPETDLALVVSFNQQPTLVQPLTQELSKLDGAVRSLTDGGETAVFDAVALAAGELSALPEFEPVRRVIILVTDGADNRSHINLDQAVEHALRAESVIYVIETDDFPLTQEDKRAEEVTKYLADATGGRTLSGHSDSDLSSSFRKIHEELRSQYAVGYRPHHLISGLLFYPVRILGPKGIRIRHRAGYYAH